MKNYLGCGLTQENEMSCTVKYNKDSPPWFGLLTFWNISSNIAQAVPSLIALLNLLFLLLHIKCFTAVILVFCTDQELQTTIRYDE
jgi:hypothetical protein